MTGCALPLSRPLSCAPALARRHHRAAHDTPHPRAGAHTMQGGAASLGAFLEAAPPPLYLVYMLAAGVGFPCSEDALVVGTWTR